MERGPIVGPVPFRIFFPFSEEKKENEEEVSRSIANNTEICYFIRNGNRARRSVKESVPAGIQVCVSLVYTWPIGFRKFREKKKPFSRWRRSNPDLLPRFSRRERVTKGKRLPQIRCKRPHCASNFFHPRI